MDEIFTVGHSTHPIERFVALLRSASVEAIVDVRRYPGSRRHPQFNAGRLGEALAAAGIEYVRLGDELGGRRSQREAKRARGRTAETSQSEAAGAPIGMTDASAWRNRSFAAYADYMRADEFARGLARLEGLGREWRVAFMCAEADWRRCHRRLISDALTTRGWRVRHLRPGGTEEHPPTMLGESGD